MKRSNRIALEILGPPILGAAFFEVVVFVATLELEMLAAFPFFLFFAFLLAGLPSLAFAAIMEFAFSRGLDPRSWWTVLLAACLGAPSGFAVMGPHNLNKTGGYTLLGVMIGCAIGLLIRWRSRAGGTSSAPATADERVGIDPTR